ncbi:MAG: hypothetical protein ACE5JH_12715, partial [Acidobacteriota bacterium]
MLQLLWLIPLLPLLGFAVNGLFGTRFLSRRAVALLGCGAALAPLLLSSWLVLNLCAECAVGGALESLVTRLQGGGGAGGGPGPRGVE